MKIKDYRDAQLHYTKDDRGDATGAFEMFVAEVPSSMDQEPRNMYADGQLVSNTVDGSRPGYSGKPPTTKHLGNGVYELTHERGSKTYYGKYERNKKSFKKSFGNDKEAAENFVKEGKKTPVAKNVIDIQSESGTLLEQPKYKANLTKALDEVSALQEKGYGNIDSIAKKYQKIFTQKIGSKTKAGTIIKTGTGSTEYRAITFAINEHAKKLGIQSIDNANVVKALDAYSKIKNPKRGNIPKILKKFNVPEGSFSKYLNTLNLRKKIPLQFGSEAAKKKYYAKIRNDAIREFSSNKFEKFLIAPETALVQKSHMGDLYNQYVRTGNLGYAPNLINQETLKTVDTTLKDYNEQINDLLKNKPKGYRAKVDLLNQQGNDLAAATQGYKKFTGRDPFTGKEFTLNFSKPSQELDPTNLLGNKKLSDLTAADKPTLEMLKEDAIKNAKLSKTKTNKISKEILSQLEKLDLSSPELKKLMAFCPAGTKVVKAAAGGGRMGYADGPMCSPEEAAKGMQQEIKKIQSGTASKGEISRTTNKLKNFGVKGMRALVKAGLVSEVLLEAALGFDRVISEGQSPVQAFRKSYLTAPLRAIGAVKSFEEGEREELLETARDKGKVRRVLDLKNLIANQTNLANKIKSLKSNLNAIKSIGGNTVMAEKNLAAAQAKLQDMRRSGELSGAEKLFSTKQQDLKLKDKSLRDAYTQAFEKRAANQASKSFIAQSKAADRNRLRDRMKSEDILTIQDAKNELQGMGDYFGQGYTPFGLNKLFEEAGMQNPGYGITKVGPATGKYNQAQGLQDYLNSMRMQQIADAGGVANLAGGGIAGLSGGDKSGPPPESGPASQGLRSLIKNGRKL